MTAPALDLVIHAPKRLAIMAVLQHSAGADFSFLREQFALSDSDLSKQMSALQRAGYVSVSKSRPGRGGTTTYRITGPGRAAFTSHLAALTALTQPSGGDGRPVAL